MVKTCIFSYNQIEKELTQAQASLTQTFPLSRTTEITKNIFTIGKDKTNDIVLFDEYVSNCHCKIEFRDSKFMIKDLQSTNGTFLNGHRIVEAYLPNQATLVIGKARFTFEAKQESKKIEPNLHQNYFFGMVSNHSSMKEVFAAIESLQDATCPVLIQGETGTGKELIARAIHENSSRKSNRFISVNCGAIAKELIESELFGHEKGAFTGAISQREGLFELAHGGTLFLDEIGELPMDLQPKLLRVLETGEIRRVGGSKNIYVDVRIVTATHRDLPHEILNQRFREDLYYRIYVMPITLPALRDRKEDIALLADYFLKQKKTLSKEAMQKLIAHNWPGNVRELKNVMERAHLFSEKKKEIEPHHIRFASAAVKAGPALTPGLMTLEEVEKIAITEALKKNHWRKTETAAKLGIAKSTLHEKVKKYGIFETT